LPDGLPDVHRVIGTAFADRRVQNGLCQSPEATR
jgi:hypothetical protein